MVEIHQNINRKDMIISKAFDFIIIMIQLVFVTVKLEHKPNSGNNPSTNKKNVSS